MLIFRVTYCIIPVYASCEKLKQHMYDSKQLAAVWEKCIERAPVAQL